jgi:quercetin dioxygenase-like cupin family protein
MVIKDLLKQLNESANPVAKVLHKTEHSKVLVIGFKKGMLLKEHKTQLPSKLTILSGSVVYKENDKIKELSQYDEVEIPVNIIHSVEAKEDSLCLLTQG